MLRLAFIFITLAFISVEAYALLCTDLFANKPPAVNIQVLKKSETQKHFNKLKSKSIDPDLFNVVQLTLTEISRNGTSSLTKEQFESLLEFRKQVSILRSAYEVLSESHRSPKKFDEFVKEIGKIKDLATLKENYRSKKLAGDILETITVKKLNKMLVSNELANRKSIVKYIHAKLDIIKTVLVKTDKTVEEVHDMRKALRNIFRYMEIQKKVLDLNETDKASLKLQLKHLREINHELGLVCDESAALILSKKLTKKDHLEIPSELYHKINYFITHANVQNFGGD